MRRFRARGNGLSLSVVEWEAHAPARATCLLLHGFMDAAASFDLVAPAIAAAGYRVIAPDLRGFGESDRVTGGGYYHFSDYIADVDALVTEHVAGDLFVVGHSMGGTIATLFTGSRPERVKKLAVLEGVGPLDTPDDMAPLRLRKWLDELASLPEWPTMGASPPNPGEGSGRSARLTMNEEDALRRLITAHPRVPREVLASRIPILTKRLEDGALVWRFDPLHRTTSPMPFFARVYGAFAARATCPVLYVTGGPLGWRVPDEDARVAMFTNATRIDLPNAGHMMHWTEPTALSAALIAF